MDQLEKFAEETKTVLPVDENGFTILPAYRPPKTKEEKEAKQGFDLMDSIEDQLDREIKMRLWYRNRHKWAREQAVVDAWDDYARGHYGDEYNDYYQDEIM